MKKLAALVLLAGTLASGCIQSSSADLKPKEADKTADSGGTEAPGGSATDDGNLSGAETGTETGTDLDNEADSDADTETDKDSTDNPSASDPGPETQTPGETGGGDTKDGEGTPVPPPEATPVVLVSLAVDTLPTKIIYRTGESADLAGLAVSEIYSDNTHLLAVLSEYTTVLPDMNTAGKKKVRLDKNGISVDFYLFIYDGDNFMLLEGAPFAMGEDSDSYADNAVHQVSVRNFLLSRFEVTYRQWREVYEWAVSESAEAYLFANAGKEGNHGTVGAAPTESGKTEPATYMNWLDAVVWCNAASEKQGLSPVYYADAVFTAVVRSSKTSVSIYVNSASSGYRLPTEAEWEYAAGGGSDGGGSYGGGRDGAGSVGRSYYAGTDELSLLPDYAWYPASCRAAGEENTTYPAGVKKMNGYGLNDMSGNVAEWCQDWYDASWYALSPMENPTGPSSGTGDARVLRGGGFSGTLKSLGVSARSFLKYSGKSGATGIRLARNAD